MRGAACEWEADWVVRQVDNSITAEQPMGSLLLLSFGYVRWKLKVCKGGVFYNKAISFPCARGSVCLCSPLLQVTTIYSDILYYRKNTSCSGTTKYEMVFLKIFWFFLITIKQLGVKIFFHMGSSKTEVF